MDRNIKIARRLVRIARMLVSERVLDEAVQKGESLPEEKKKEALDIVTEIVDESGNPEAKRLLEQIVNSSSCNGRRMVAFDFIEKIMKFSGDSQLVRALLVAAAMMGAISTAEAKNIYFKSGDEIKALQVEDGKYNETEQERMDFEQAAKHADELSRQHAGASLDTSGVEIADEGNAVYITVTFRKDQFRDAVANARSEFDRQYPSHKVDFRDVKRGKGVFRNGNGSFVTTFFLVLEDSESASSHSQAQNPEKKQTVKKKNSQKPSKSSERSQDDETVRQFRGIRNPDGKFAMELAEKVSSGNAGDVIVEEKDGVSYIAVRGKDGMGRMDALEYLESKAQDAMLSKYGNNLTIRGWNKSGYAFGQNRELKALTYTFNTPGE